MEKFIFLSLLCSLGLNAAPIAISHQNLPRFEKFGNEYLGVATKPLGAQQTEVWVTGLGPLQSTPVHSHSTEEIIVLLEGKLKATSNNHSIECEAPCTIILPQGEQHILYNPSNSWTRQLAIMPLGSKIQNAENKEITLEWRNSKASTGK